MNRHGLSSMLRGVVAWCALLPFSIASVGAQTSLCCPADFNADAIVDGADLGAMLGAWGACPGCPEDLDGDGAVDGGDLGLLLGAWDECPALCLKTRVIGIVQLSSGAPVADAMVITDQGGSGVSAVDGSFSFIVDLGAAVPTLQVTAVTTINGATFMGSTPATPVVLDGITNAGVIVILADDGAPTCDDLTWLPTFLSFSGPNQTILALGEFDDGSGGGPALYVGGSFTSTGGIAANRIARWGGSTWSPLGSGVNSFVRALAVFDDGSGSGPALYVGGSFSSAGGAPASRIARWDGSSWSAVGSGLDGVVHAMTVFDDGSGGGPALYVGGQFSSAGGVTAFRVARWDGSTWSPVGTGISGFAIHALTVFDDGSGRGPALYAGGAEVVAAGGIPATGIARWDGSSWSPVGEGTSDTVRALAVFDDGSGSGPALYAGGDFLTAGGVGANRIARWNGSIWSPLGVGVNGAVRALAVVNDGPGGSPRLAVGGSFTNAGGLRSNRLAYWNGSNWSAILPALNDEVFALTAFDDGTVGGPGLYIGGNFTLAGVFDANRIAHRRGSTWWMLGSAPNGNVRTFASFDDGSGGGHALYVGGGFQTTGGISANRIARWDGSRWLPLGSGMDNQVRGLTVFDDGSSVGPALHACGDFGTAGGVQVNHIARWNGSSWSALGNGLNGWTHAMTVFDGGSRNGPGLYAGGEFSSAGGVAASGIARWDGSTWSPLGSGLNGNVLALAVFDDGAGSGPALYAGGQFTAAGGVSANRIAKWDGSNWSPVASGLNGDVLALIVFDDGAGSGPALYAGGQFTAAGDVTANRIAKWDGSDWSPLGSGLNGVVSAMTVFDDGAGGGPALYVGGQFSSAGGVTAMMVARWDGSNWSPLVGGTSSPSAVVRALAVFNDGSGGGNRLYAGGQFSGTPPSPGNIAVWGCPATTGP